MKACFQKENCIYQGCCSLIFMYLLTFLFQELEVEFKRQKEEQREFFFQTPSSCDSPLNRSQNRSMSPGTAAKSASLYQFQKIHNFVNETARRCASQNSDSRRETFRESYLFIFDPFNNQCSLHVETSQLIYKANQFTSSDIKKTLIVSGLKT